MMPFFPPFSTGMYPSADQAFIPHRNFQTLRDPHSPRFKLIADQLMELNLDFFVTAAEREKTGFIFGKNNFCNFQRTYT